MSFLLSIRFLYQFQSVLLFGFDLVSKEMIENNFNNKKEMKANIELKLFGTQSPSQS